MFALPKKLSRSPKAVPTTTRMAAPRAAAVEPLEDRRLCSGTVASFSWGASNSALPAVQHPVGANTQIIAILIGL